MSAMSPGNTAPRHNPQLNMVLWLALPLGLVIAPHALNLPAWLGLFWLACAGWRLHLARKAFDRLPRGVLGLLTVLGIAGLLYQFRTLLGPQGGVAFLVLLTGLKLLETRSPRDHVVMLLVGYFLLLALFLENQSLPMAAYALASATVLAAALAHLQMPAQSLRRSLRVASSLMLQAIPIAVLLFIFVPRMAAPLGGLIQTDTGQTGLSESMRPGSISQLMRSDAPAFRAEFDPGVRVQSRDLYWRGPVFWRYDGTAWSPGRFVAVDEFDLDPRGSPLRYRVTLEPHRRHWLLVHGLAPALKGIEDLQPRLSADLEWQASKPVDQRLRYEVEAWPDYRLDADRPPDPRALDLPAGANPRSRALGAQWAVDFPEPAERVQAALRLFRENPFFYTLRPPALGQDAMDSFLFDTRRGYCEHYASAFVVLMRAAGVPARVVTGYQGGEFNALGNYWIVRQRDAHAWAEVWLAGQGWTRVDPTAAVSPDRVERGSAEALPAAERPLSVVDVSWLKPVRLAWDMANNRWYQWVLSYNEAGQRNFLSRLHPALASLEGMLWASAIGAVGLLLLVFAWLFWPARRGPVTPLARAYARFCDRLAAVGIPRQTGEGPTDFARRAEALRPDLAEPLRAITAAYLRLRYGPAVAGEAELKAFRQRVSAFRPGRQPPTSAPKPGSSAGR